MTYEQNVRAILECNFAGFKEELIDNAVENIMALEQQPRTDVNSIIAEQALKGGSNWTECHKPQSQDLDYSIILGIDTDHLNELLNGKAINTADVLKDFKNIIDEQGLEGLEHWKTDFGGLIDILYDAVQGSSVEPQDGDLISRKAAIKAINKRLDKVPNDRPDVAFGLCVAAGVIHDMPSVSQDDCDTECIYCKHCFEGSEFEPQEGDDLR